METCQEVFTLIHADNVQFLCIFENSLQCSRCDPWMFDDLSGRIHIKLKVICTKSLASHQWLPSRI